MNENVVIKTCCIMEKSTKLFAHHAFRHSSSLERFYLLSSSCQCFFPVRDFVEWVHHSSIHKLQNISHIISYVLDAVARWLRVWDRRRLYNSVSVPHICMSFLCIHHPHSFRLVYAFSLGNYGSEYFKYKCTTTHNHSLEQQNQPKELATKLPFHTVHRRFKLCVYSKILCMCANSQNQQPLSIGTPFVDNGNNIPYSPEKQTLHCHNEHTNCYNLTSVQNISIFKLMTNVFDGWASFRCHPLDTLGITRIQFQQLRTASKILRGDCFHCLIFSNAFPESDIYTN